MLSIRSLTVAAAALCTTAMTATAQAAPVEIQWWHAMAGKNGELLNQFADEFNKSQADYKVVPVFKGGYADTLNAGIAAFRAGQAPALLQVFEVGTATMMAAKGAVKPVYQVMADAGEKFDPQSYLPAVTGYYSTKDGKMLSFPFNSSTPVMYINKDAFKKAGLDPNAPPKTWPEFFDDAKKLKASGSACGFTVGWMAWTQLEVFSAWHNQPIATDVNGIGGTDAVLEINGPLQVRHLQDLVDAAKDKSFDYAGRTTEPEAKFVSGDCAMIQTSSGGYGVFKANAKFEFGVAPLPYYPDVAGAPQNTIIGGASLWVMGGKTPAEYKGVAKFMSFLSQTPIQVQWHEATGYLQITKAAYEQTQKDGFYDKTPGFDVAIKELTNKAPTDNSKGLRLGNLPQIRDIVAEEVEAALNGTKTPKDALDSAVTRGNVLLRQFEKTAS
ncbi:MAG TPA: sn-glycerol-3-phosphate ABC transporter substrate-binding protein UgpB [Aliidongia sp.]|nr:sn-glycerol-3-phosphate ABC transporter substrate-binding protein UgpB [Aliidongia sp.]